MAEILQLHKPLQDEDGEFRKFINEMFNNATKVALIARSKNGKEYYVYCSEESKIEQLRMMFRLQETVKELVEHYPDPDEKEEDEEDE